MEAKIYGFVAPLVSSFQYKTAALGSSAAGMVMDLASP